MATGDFAPGISDLDLVALVGGPVDATRQTTLTTMHRHIDEGTGSGFRLGCVYVDSTKISDLHMRHPTWTHGLLVQRALSGITRAELVRHGYAVFGRSPREVFPAMSDDDVREAARAELTGYWTWAARRPWLWLDPVMADLGLTSMARGRYTMANGALLSKTPAVAQADAPAWFDQPVARQTPRRERHLAPRADGPDRVAGRSPDRRAHGEATPDRATPDTRDTG